MMCDMQRLVSDGGSLGPMGLIAPDGAGRDQPVEVFLREGGDPVGDSAHPLTPPKPHRAAIILLPPGQGSASQAPVTALYCKETHAHIRTSQIFQYSSQIFFPNAHSHTPEQNKYAHTKHALIVSVTLSIKYSCMCMDIHTNNCFHSQ